MGIILLDGTLDQTYTDEFALLAASIIGHLIVAFDWKQKDIRSTVTQNGHGAISSTQQTAPKAPTSKNVEVTKASPYVLLKLVSLFSMSRWFATDWNNRVTRGNVWVRS